MEKLLSELNRQMSEAKSITLDSGISEICASQLEQIAGGSLADGEPWYLNDGKGGVGFIQASKP